MRWVLALAAAALTLSAADLEQHETIQKTFSGSKSIEIDNVYGSIHATGYSGRDLVVEAKKTTIADDNERAAAAGREVKLDVTDTGGEVKMYVDGPFRCNCDNHESFRTRHEMHEHGHRGYKVVYDFEVKVPAGAAVYLGTINEGKILVDGTSGDFDIENINGGVQMNDVSGSGRVYALNGGVHVTFTKNPEHNSYFGSLNGVVDVAFQPNLSADVRVKNFNGGVYTDFQVASLPVLPATAEHRDGKWVYRSKDFQGFRIGNGGPEYKFDGFNGNIQIKNRGKQ
ncbi:MAG TPA: hypothetical protein VKU01_21510 [Bryobacteraceae bacterium]|nr:hypothetical protein [Bryobacteraceae bacterium]